MQQAKKIPNLFFIIALYPFHYFYRLSKSSFSITLSLSPVNPSHEFSSFAIPGQGTMSLAGAGQSPHNYCRQAISAVRRTRTPQSKTSVLRFLLPTGTPPSGAPEPHHKQNDSFAPIRVKGGCPLRVQGGARIIIAARQSPPTGAPTPHKAKRQFCAFYCRKAPRRQAHPPPTKQNDSFALFIADRQSPPSGVPPKKPPCLRPQRRQRIPAPSEAPPKAAPALPVCSQPGSNQVPQPAKTKSEDGLKDHRERG